MKYIIIPIIFLLSLLSLNARKTPMLVHSNSSLQVYNLQPEGFVIVSTDNSASEVLGFSDHGSFNPDSLPLGLADLLDSYNQEILAYGSHVARTNFDFSLLATKPDSVYVSPLLQNNWSQGKYYNYACPEDSKGDGGHVMVGCGAIVMGQVMHYWRYPVHGKGSRSYVCNYSSYGYGNYGTLSADFEHTYYDYDNMPSKLSSSSTEAQVDAVSTLLYHCGVACNMVYGPTASTAQSGNMVNALTTYFRFQNTVEYVEKSDYSTSQWHTLIQSELDEGAPFCYGASGSYGGHVFVCDGYGETNSTFYYHLNWGWGGSYNGWFKISAFNPGPYDFNSNHSAIIGIRGDHLPSAVDDVTNEQSVAAPKVEKFIIDGHLYIKVNDRIFTITGQPIL